MLKKILKYKKQMAVTLLAVVVFTSGFALGQNTASARIISVFSSKKPENVDFSPVWTVWNVLNEKFVPAQIPDSDKNDLSEEEKIQNRIWGMAKGLVASLGDPYTVFLPPSENKTFNEDIKGEFEGVGMEVAIKDGILTVVSPLKDSPAEKAGIKANDKVVKIDGVSTEDMSIQDAVYRIRGKAGTTVTLEVAREGESELIKIPIVRAKIKIPTIETEKRDDGIFVIALFSFTQESPILFRDALVEFINSKYDKLIIDLRGNPGGYLDAAVDIASWFLPKGAVVVTEDFGDKRPEQIYRSKGNNLFTDKLKLVILTNKGSASASEILAGALRAHKRAKIIGTNSFGKGSVQELVPITPDTSLKVTVARWVLPDETWIGGEGLKPDIEVKFPSKEEIMKNPEKLKELEDRDLIMEEAVKYLKSLK